MGGATIKFDNLGKLLKVKESEEFRSMTARMSCLMTIARMRNDFEVSHLIDIVNELKIGKRYLIVSADTAINTTLSKKRTIDFNVIINHKEQGETMIFFIYDYPV